MARYEFILISTCATYENLSEILIRKPLKNRTSILSNERFNACKCASDHETIAVGTVIIELRYFISTIGFLILPLIDTMRRTHTRDDRYYVQEFERSFISTFGPPADRREPQVPL